MKTLILTLIYTILLTIFTGEYNEVQAQNDYFDTDIGNLIEENGVQNDQNYQSQNNNTQYDNVIIQNADGTEYRSNQNNISPNNPNQNVQHSGYNQTQTNNQQYQPVSQMPSNRSGLGENLYSGNNTKPRQNPNFNSNGYNSTGNNSTPQNYPNNPNNYPAQNTYNNPTGNTMSGNNPNYNSNQRPNISQPISHNTELTDFGVQPTSQLYAGSPHGPTPTSIPGGKIITTNQLQSMVMNGQNNTLIFDVLNGQQHLPGAIPASQGAAPGSFSDQIQQKMGQFLSQVTRGNKQIAMVFYCQSNYCWMSYNAALRAINLGYTNVYWYRGGLEAWQNKGLSIQYANNNNRY